MLVLSSEAAVPFGCGFADPLLVTTGVSCRLRMISIMIASRSYEVVSLTGQIIRKVGRCCLGATRAIWRSYQELDSEQREETLDTAQ